jgi:sulfite reductase (ferredoxin)
MADPRDEETRPAVTLNRSELPQMSGNERIKAASQGLYYVGGGKGEPHSFIDEVEALERGESPTISHEAKELSKFFGIYKQQGRTDRGKKTDDYFFMVRIKNPAGGALSAAQWVALDEAAERFADGSVRLTSRQGVQYHRVYGTQLAPLVRHLNRHYRERGTLGACGDVNRNVMCSPIDELDPAHEVRAGELARAIAEDLSPRSSAYFQIWISDEEGRNRGVVSSDEPVYGDTYLPRKFKIGIAHPRDNSIDVLTQDVGFVPVEVEGRADGSAFDLYTGGGLGLTHNKPATAALLALHLGRVRREQVVEAARAIAILQKENGERKDRRQARWKYTLRRLGLEAVKQELKTRFHLELEEAPPRPLPPLDLHLGWHEQRGGLSYCGISIENGRIQPPLRRAIREAVEAHQLQVVLTPQQDLILAGARDRDAVQRILDAHGVARPDAISRVRRNAMACPAKPTCGLAMTEAERILPRYVDAIEEAGYGDVDAVIRMTGCPNNCARPPTAEIGIYGYGKNDHVILVGGARDGSRLARTLYGRLPEEQMIPALVGLFRAIAERNRDALPVGEFLHRSDPEQLRTWIGLEGAE